MKMKTQNHGTILERSLLWMFKAYLASYLALEEKISKKYDKKAQKTMKI